MSQTGSNSLYEESLPTKAKLFWVRYRWIDLAIAGVIVVLWLEAGRREWVPCFFTEVGKAQRQALYQSVMTISATMGGFTLTSVSILINLMRTPLTALERLLPAEDKAKVGDVVVGALPSLAATFVVATIGLLVDSSSDVGNWKTEAALSLTTVTSFLALCRVTWVVRRLLAGSHE